MSRVGQDAVLGQIRRLFGPGTVSGLSEWQLLDRYVSQRDEAAFEALVVRHGPMVLGVCKRVLTDPRDVEDAFQATFLVLVRKAGALGERDALGHWLFGVAQRVALKARGIAARRGTRELRLESEPACAGADGSRVELRQILDEELRRLPDKYRAPIVLCYLEGLSHEEAALQLRWPIGTVKGRLSRARELLRGRLTRRGVELTAAVLSLSLSDASAVSLPESLRSSTVSLAIRSAAGSTAAGAVPASLTTLVEGVLETMILAKLKSVGAAALVVAGFAVGAGVIAQSSSTSPAQDAPRPNEPASAAAPAGPKGTPSAPATDPADDVRTRGEPDPIRASELSQVDLATTIFNNLSVEYFQHGRGDVGELVQWSERIVQGTERLIPTRAERIAALSKHLERLESLEQGAKALQANGRSERRDMILAKFYRQEARLALARAKSGLETDAPRPSAPADEAGRDDPRSAAISRQLEEPIAMSFGNPTPLEDVLKYIQEAMKKRHGKPLPVYIDPKGLQEAEATMTSPVSLDLEGVPLRTTLTLALKQLGLTYKVEEGVLMIKSATIDEEESPLNALFQKAERGELSDADREKLTASLKTLNDITKLQLETAKMRGESAKAGGMMGGGTGGGFR